MLSPNHFFSQTLRYFHTLTLLPKYTKALKALNINKPTDIQSKAIPTILEGHNTIINSETGSGKTLSFLLPIIQSLSQINNEKTKSPGAIILLHSKELCWQTSFVISRFSKTLASILVNESNSPISKCHLNHFPSPILHSIALDRHQLHNWFSSQSILLTTPGVLIQHPNLGQLLSHTKYLVVDEADVLHSLSLKKSASLPFLMQLIRKSCSDSSQLQWIFSGATLYSSDSYSNSAKDAVSFIRKKLPSAVLLQTSRLRSLPSTLKEEFIVVPDGCEIFEWKMDALKTLIEHHRTSVTTSRTMIIFCNTVQSMDSCYSALSRSFSASGSSTFLQLLKAQGTYSSLQERLYHFKDLYSGSKQFLVVVSTDLFARGIDIPNISLVVQFDIANHVNTYQHRVGRTARAGSNGEAITFVETKERHLVEDILLYRKPRNQIMPESS